MAYTSGFFDAIDQGGGDYDRIYSAATFAHYFSLLVQNGVFPDPSTGMQVKASTSPDMHVSVQPGSGWVNGYYITVEANAPEQLTVPTANPSLSRIDSVIMGLNYVDREVQLYIKSGAVSASPSAVSLQRDNDLYELELAQITVSAGMASITQANITDMRSNTNRCGIVKGMIDQIDTTDLFAQYNDAFQTWFAGIKAQLSDNVATNLQNQIDNLKTDKVNVSDKASTVQAQAGTDDTKWMTPALVRAFVEANLSDQISQNSQSITALKKALSTIPGALEKIYSQNTPGSYSISIPSDASLVYAFAIGGGGGGGGGSRGYASGSGGGGGGGGYPLFLGPIIPSSIKNKKVVVGSGGKGGLGGGVSTNTSYNGEAGASGGTSSVFGLATALGGGGGGPGITQGNDSSAGIGSSNGGKAEQPGSAAITVNPIEVVTMGAGGGGGGNSGGTGGSAGTATLGNAGAGGSNGGEGGSATLGSGGGGGCCGYDSIGGNGGNGGAGYVAIWIQRKKVL